MLVGWGVEQRYPDDFRPRRRRSGPLRSALVILICAAPLVGSGYAFAKWDGRSSRTSLPAREAISIIQAPGEPHGRRQAALLQLAATIRDGIRAIRQAENDPGLALDASIQQDHFRKELR